MTTISKDHNTVTQDGIVYRFVHGGPCRECALVTPAGDCAYYESTFPCCHLFGRTDGRMGNFQLGKDVGMDKREFNGAVTAVCIFVLAIIGAAVMLHRVAGPYWAGAVFIAAAYVIARASAKAYRRLKDEQTAEQVAKQEQLRAIAGEARRAYYAELNHFERLAGWRKGGAK
jgi:hypothetical protein